jgi:hypothetical protein
MALLVVKGGATKKFALKPNLVSDWQTHLKRTWLAHLEAAQCAVPEASVMHGVSCPRACCSSRTYLAEVRRTKK